MRKEISEFIVVVTGASSGIGRATALAFAQKGSGVVLVARRDEALRDAAIECSATAETLVVPADVTDEPSVHRVVAQALEKFGHIDVWVNNAAVTAFGPFEAMPSDVYRRVFETNFFGYVNGARAVLPHFRQRGRGTLINVSSQVGRAPIPYANAYVASKYAIRGWSESLRQELRSTAIQVCTVLPGSIDTPLFQQAANYMGRKAQPLHPVHEAERVAETVIQLAERPRREVLVGKGGRAFFMFHDLLPALFDPIVAAVVRRAHFQSARVTPGTGNVFEPSPFTSISGGWLDRHPGRGVRLTVTGLRLALLGGALWWLARWRSSRG